jgi:hypothetical protein
MQRLLIIDDNKTTTRIVLKVLNKRLGVDADLAMSFKELKGLLTLTLPLIQSPYVTITSPMHPTERL